MALYSDTELKVNHKGFLAAKKICAKMKNPQVRKRAFKALLCLDALADYLVEQGFEIEISKNLHKILPMNEEFEFTDIHYNGRFIDILPVVSQNYVLIPKIHFTYGIIPDLYIVADYDRTTKKVKILGCIEPENIDKSKQNEKYYIADTSQLSEPNLIEEMLSSVKATTVTDKNHEIFQSYFIDYIDGILNADNKKRLITHLIECPSCRNTLVEFFDYETIAKNTVRFPDILNDETLDIVGAAAVNKEKYKNFEEITLEIDKEPDEYEEDEQENTNINPAIDDSLQILYGKGKNREIFDILNGKKKNTQKSVLNEVIKDIPKTNTEQTTKVQGPIKIDSVKSSGTINPKYYEEDFSDGFDISEETEVKEDIIQEETIEIKDVSENTENKEPEKRTEPPKPKHLPHYSKSGKPVFLEDITPIYDEEIDIPKFKEELNQKTNNTMSVQDEMILLDKTTDNEKPEYLNKTTNKTEDKKEDKNIYDDLIFVEEEEFPELSENEPKNELPTAMDGIVFVDEEEKQTENNDELIFTSENNEDFDILSEESNNKEEEEIIYENKTFDDSETLSNIEELNNPSEDNNQKIAENILEDNLEENLIHFNAEEVDLIDEEPVEQKQNKSEEKIPTSISAAGLAASSLLDYEEEQTTELPQTEDNNILDIDESDIINSSQINDFKNLKVTETKTDNKTDEDVLVLDDTDNLILEFDENGSSTSDDDELDIQISDVEQNEEKIKIDDDNKFPYKEENDYPVISNDDMFTQMKGFQPEIPQETPPEENEEEPQNNEDELIILDEQEEQKNQEDIKIVDDSQDDDMLILDDEESQNDDNMLILDDDSENSSTIDEEPVETDSEDDLTVVDDSQDNDMLILDDEESQNDDDMLILDDDSENPSTIDEEPVETDSEDDLTVVDDSQDDDMLILDDDSENNLVLEEQDNAINDFDTKESNLLLTVEDLPSVNSDNLILDVPQLNNGAEDTIGQDALTEDDLLYYDGDDITAVVEQIPEETSSISSNTQEYDLDFIDELPESTPPTQENQHEYAENLSLSNDDEDDLVILDDNDNNGDNSFTRPASLRNVEQTSDEEFVRPAGAVSYEDNLIINNDNDEDVVILDEEEQAQEPVHNENLSFNNDEDENMIIPDEEDNDNISNSITSQQEEQSPQQEQYAKIKEQYNKLQEQYAQQQQYAQQLQEEAQDDDVQYDEDGFEIPKENAALADEQYYDNNYQTYEQTYGNYEDTQQPKEIPADEPLLSDDNLQEEPQETEEEESYEENNDEYDEDNEKDQENSNKNGKNKKTIIIAVAVTLVVVFLLSIGIGIKSLSDSKKKKAAIEQTATNTDIMGGGEEEGLVTPDANNENLQQENTENSTDEETGGLSVPDEETGGLAIPDEEGGLSVPQTPPSTPKAGTENATTEDMNKAVANAFSDNPTSITVRKVSWGVNAALAGDTEIKRYLQNTGKAIQVALQKNIASIKGVTPSNKTKIQIKIGEDGQFKDFVILKSSGIPQIDEVVLQSVKDTVCSLQPPTFSENTLKASEEATGDKIIKMSITVTF